ncbi:MAG TPA: glycosyltransferase [Polyangiales bacterium]|nr:glycosyltransferase [Polyangiales bacterium]
MFSAPVSICLALTAVALFLHRMAYWATLRQTAPPREPWPHRPLPLTVLKPIKGLEEELEQNLRSFFEQDYPAPLQLVFASTEPGDPGIALARRIAEQYPAVESKFVLSDPSFGTNPKVSNLAGALRAAAHDLVLQTDANVRVRPGYLRALVDEWQASGASMLGALIAARGERSLGAVLDNIQITSFTTPGICLAERLAGITCVLGKSMLFRRSELESLGGLALVKDVLAEDYVLGQTYAAAGKRVALSSLAVDNINVAAPVSRFLSRHSRWLKMRVVVHLGGFIADLISNATFFSFLAFVLSGFELQLGALYAAVVVYKVWLDRRLMLRLRSEPLALSYALCMPLRDLVLPCIWLYASVSRTTEWRGERFRLSRGSLLTPIARHQPEVAVSEDSTT